MPTEASNFNNDIMLTFYRVSDAEINNRVLRSTLNDLSYELFSKTLSKNTNTDLTRSDTSVQTGDEFCQSKVVSVEASNTRSFKQYLWKFRFVVISILLRQLTMIILLILKKIKVTYYIHSHVLSPAS